MRQNNRNPWKLLNITQDATKEEIKKAWKLASLKHHPDRGGDADMFRAVNDAYRKLKEGTHVPIIEANPTRFVNVKLTPQQQVLGVNGFIKTDEGQLLDVKIPKGARRDDRYSVQLDSQSIILNVKEAADPVFTRQGNSLIIDIEVDIITAMCGGTVEINSAAGEVISVDIPAGVTNNHVICIPNEGLYYKNKHRRGNLHCVLNVKIPVLNTDEQKENFIKRLKNE